MNNPIARRFRTSVAAAAVGVTLVVGLGACSSSSAGGHNEATTQVCSELEAQVNTMIQSMATLAPALSDPSNLTGDQGQQMINGLKAALGTMVTNLRAASGRASDSGFSKALTDAANSLESDVSKINTVADLANLENADTTSLNALDTYCPNASFSE